MLAYGRGRWAVSKKLYREKITSRIPKVPRLYLRLKWYEYGLQFYPGGVLLGIPGGGAPHGSLNPDTISNQPRSFFPPIFRPGFQKPLSVFRFGLYEIMSSLLRLEHQRKRFLSLLFI